MTARLVLRIVAYSLSLSQVRLQNMKNFWNKHLKQNEESHLNTNIYKGPIQQGREENKIEIDKNNDNHEMQNIDREKKV